MQDDSVVAAAPSTERTARLVLPGGASLESPITVDRDQWTIAQFPVPGESLGRSGTVGVTLTAHRLPPPTSDLVLKAAPIGPYLDGWEAVVNLASR
ncbi:hypothetical protein [Sinosporangium siamense]|uniref:hypothetical protein n=1 Tax=Sinosporangium siamense TaxID=1367973 RepID=UPI00194DF63F|nr:hypothetical protein [Sinosporangium siamense]